MATGHQFTEDDFNYPSSDGMPRGESDSHRKAVTDLVARLDARYADSPDVYVSGDIKVYWEKWNPYEVVVPDCFVVFGVSKADRDKYIGWVEGVLPSVVLEVGSREGSPLELDAKSRVYEDVWRVSEYFVFNPTEREPGPPLRGYRRVKDRFVPIVLLNDALTSQTLGISLTASDGKLILRDAATGAPVMTAPEAENARLRAELAALELKKKPKAH